MSSLSVSAACTQLSIDASLDDLKVIFPGGGILKIPTPPGIDVAFAIDFAKQFLAAINAALQPLQPIFNLIELLIAIVDFIKAVPDAITHLSPGKLINAIPNIVSKLEPILAMIPPLSIPIFIKTLLNVLIVMLQGLQATLQVIGEMFINASLASDRADALDADFPAVAIELRAAADCAKGAASVSIKGLSQGLAPLDELLKLMKALIDIIGIPVKFPTIADLGEDAEAAANIVQGLIDVLNVVRLAIPV